MTPAVPRTLFLALAAVALTPEVLAAAPVFKMVVDPANAEHGVKTISLVQNPAIQRGWVALSALPVPSIEGGAVPSVANTPKRFHLSEAGQRQVLTGPALIPGQQILRLDEQGNPFYITFDEEAIAASQRQFALQLRHTSTNQDHATPLAGNVVEENWIIRDPACDTALALGLGDLPKGTWMLSVHIPDATYWQNEVLSGNKTGFSIEGLFDTQQLNLSAAAPAAKPTIMGYFEKLWAKLSSLKKDTAGEIRAALGLEQLADGRAVNIDDTTGAVSVCNPDGTPGDALPDGNYPLKDGGELVVQAGKRANGEQPSADPALADASKEGDGVGAAAPAPLATDAGLPDVVAAVNSILDWLKKEGATDKTPPNPATHPAAQPVAPKMAALLKGVALANIGDKLAELKLDAVELEGGDKLTYNPLSRTLTDSKGALVTTGYYAAADGSYFSVDTSQYIWEISKTDYDRIYAAKLQEVQLQQLQAQLARTPAGKQILLSMEEKNIQTGSEDEELPPHLAHLAAVRAGAGRNA